MNPQEFAEKIRSKYPGSYDHVDDVTLSRKIVDKYPQYSSRVTFDDSSMISKVGDIVGQYEKSQIGSPQQLLQSIPALFSKASDKLGRFATESISQGPNKVDPYTAAVVGTVISMGNDVAMAGINPMGESAAVSKEVPVVGRKMASRALGFSKRFLQTPFSRGKAAQAAETALQEGVIPWSGNPETMLYRAQELGDKSGAKIGAMRQASGQHPIDSIIDDLENLRTREATSSNSAINSRIDRAKELFQGLLEKVSGGFRKVGEDVPETVRTYPKSIFGNTSQPTYRLNPATGQQELIDLGNQSTVITGGTSPSMLGTAENPPQRMARQSMRVGNNSEGVNLLGTSKPSEKFSLNTFEKLKKEIADSVNWLNDNATQSASKKIVARIEKSIEDLMRNSGQDMIDYGNQKRLFGSSKLMQQGLNNEISSQSGNRATSPYAVIAGAGQLATGNPIKAAATLGITETLMRRGAGTMARGVTEASRALPAVPEISAKVLNEAKAMEFYRKAGKDKKKARQMAIDEGWVIP